MATASLSPAVVDLPVTIGVGGIDLHLGSISVEVPARPGQVAAAVANLLRTAAQVVGGTDRHTWPRQAWYVNDSVRLPGSIARGTVVQVDQRAKRYLVDTGRGTPVSVRWADVDAVASRAALEPVALHAAVLDALSHPAGSR